MVLVLKMQDICFQTKTEPRSLKRSRDQDQGLCQRSRDQEQDFHKPNSNDLEDDDLGLEITKLIVGDIFVIPIWLLKDNW